MISTSTAFISNIYNDNKERRKDLITKKFAITEQLAKDLGERNFATYELYRSVRDKDTSELKINLKRYLASKEDWNIKYISYFALIGKYYGTDVKCKFDTTVYSPLVDLGNKVFKFTTPNNKITAYDVKTLPDQEIVVRKGIQNFITILYGYDE